MMEATATAIYEDGVLRLLTPLALPEHTRVQVRVESLVEELQSTAKLESAARTDQERDYRRRVVRRLYGIWTEEDEAAFYRLRQEIWSRWQPQQFA
jgi:predicted DNA-binding antitoxin AbrB/MazE fold protein